ncbi:Y-family DNA polymerase [Halomonas salipaludis]|uniref:DNA polymerase V subunit UmuC n=1 Tax=Halomonas salipaludis TaxID=2032625 RepID=A0A2A2F0D8_9GAMM|nr:Y-family DNA polymerase [Halomonas salipaludis]PAU78023.1 DNA polymerase V subunit UmuC [Halomonas salipaludis]
MYALVDANNFYVSCERLFAPHLEGQPVGVLSNNDGCVIARSEEFKALGIPMGVPTHKIAPALRRRITLCSSNYTLYGDLSARTQQVLAARVPGLEPYSIDESFLDLRGLSGDLNVLGAELCQAVAREVGLPVSVGIAPTRTLAKLANHRAKRQPGRPQVCVWQDGDDQDLRTTLAALPLSAVWGIGERLQCRLLDQGINTAGALRSAPSGWLQRRFGVVVARTALELAGQPCLAGTDLATPRRSILCSRSFRQALRQRESLAAALRYHCQRAGEKLRRDDLQAAAIGVFLRTNPFQDVVQHRASLWAPLAVPSADTLHLNHLAQQLLGQLWEVGLAYHKLGVMLTDLSPRQHHQASLLAPAEAPEQARLMSAWDGIRARFGREALTLGVQATEADWQMHSRQRSARYTTRWDELPAVRAR